MKLLESKWGPWIPILGISKGRPLFSAVFNWKHWFSKESIESWSPLLIAKDVFFDVLPDFLLVGFIFWQVSWLLTFIRIFQYVITGT
jgi:hypothetical protein